MSFKIFRTTQFHEFLARFFARSQAVRMVKYIQIFMQEHKVIKSEYNQKHMLEPKAQWIVNEWVSLPINLLLSLMGHLSGRKFTIKTPYYMYA